MNVEKKKYFSLVDTYKPFFFEKFQILFIERQKKRSKYLILRHGAQKNLLVIESHKTWIPFNVLSIFF